MNAKLLILGLVATAYLPCVHAATGLAVGRTVGLPGGTTKVNVNLSSDVPVVAAQFDLMLGPGVAEGVDAILGQAAAVHHVASSETAPGVRRVVLYSLLNRPLLNGTIAEVELRVLPGVPEQRAPLELANVVLSTASATAIQPLNLEAGTLTVSTALPARFTAVERLDNGNVLLRVTGTSGRQYTLETSADLLLWTSLQTNTISDGVTEFTDTSAPDNHRFYRAVLE